jgi:hypothetical protein
VVLDACEGHAVIFDNEAINQSSGKVVHRLVIRRKGP